MVVLDNAISDVESSLVIVRSDTLAIEAGGGALTVAQASLLTRCRGYDIRFSL